MDYMSRFDMDITYIKGEHNKVADCLLRYYENNRPGEIHPINEYVPMDVQLDPGGWDLSKGWIMELESPTEEIRAMHKEHRRQSCRIQEAQELRDIEAQEMEDARARAQELAEGAQEGHSDKATEHSLSKVDEDKVMRGTDPTLGSILGNGVNKTPTQPIQDDGFLESIQVGYDGDPLFGKIIDNPEDHSRKFMVRDSLIL
ncbi:hypothetical protein CYLTODRAFT_253334, partial [Cylindrobasidium torrendii FP15055 ss-10]